METPITALPDGWHALDDEGAAYEVVDGVLRRLRCGPSGAGLQENRFRRRSAVRRMLQDRLHLPQLWTGMWRDDGVDAEATIDVHGGNGRRLFVRVIEMEGERWGILEGDWGSWSSTVLINESGAMVSGELSREQYEALSEIGELSDEICVWVAHPTIPAGTKESFKVLRPRAHAVSAALV